MGSYFAEVFHLTSKHLKSAASISGIAKSIQGLTAHAVCEYSREADAIIVSQSLEKQYIERTLDGMLGFCFDKNMLKFYKRLCKYYYGIDPTAAAGYFYAYRDMWDKTKSVKISKK